VLAFRGMPKFFWPLFVLNAAILATTPVEGGHHLADTLAGVVVAILAVAIAARIRTRLEGISAAEASGEWRKTAPTIRGGTA
jgi:membrane-associated phospholipid phosphatase